MKTWAPLMEARRSARSVLSLIPAPLTLSLSSPTRVAPPISLVRAAPSRGVGRAASSLELKFSTASTL